MELGSEESLVRESKDPLVRFLNRIIIYCVKILAVFMVLVIIWLLVDVGIGLYYQLTSTFPKPFHIESLFIVFGGFLAVLIAIEIFLNIVFYLKKDAIHVPLVLATALTAVARKVIVLDYTSVNPQYIYGMAAVIFAVGITYWLVIKQFHEISNNNNS